MFTKIKRLVFNTWLLTTLISLLTFTVALAASGNLDTTFGNGGKVLTDFGGRFDRIYDIAIQPNRKIVAVGYSEGAGGKDFFLTRNNPNGALDKTFSGDGRLRVNFGGNDTAWAVELQSDNKIVVAGETCDVNIVCNVAMARLNANGSWDTTFSGDGKVVTDFAGADNNSRAIAIQSDKKIVLAGYVFNGADKDFAIYRYKPNGALDTTFSGDGRVKFGFGSGQVDDLATAIDIQNTDMKIVVVGSSSSSVNGYDFAIARLNPGGSLDTKFSGDGRQLTSFGADDIAIGFAGQPDGKMVVVGQKIDWAAPMSFFAVARYNPNGKLDTTFNVTGKKVFSIFPGLWSYGYDAFILNGKIVVLGATDVGGNIYDFAVVRLKPGGGFDNTFSNDGKVTIDFGGNDLAYAIARQPSDGKYVLGGSSSVGAGGSDFALVRVLR